VWTKELECRFPMEQSANSLTTSHAAPCKSGAKVVECDQTSVLATFIMLLREEVRRSLPRQFTFLLQVRYNNGNRIGCSIGAVFARRRGLGIPSLPRLMRSRKGDSGNAHCVHHEWVATFDTSRLPSSSKDMRRRSANHTTLRWHYS